MMKYTLKEKALTAESMQWYENQWNGKLKPTGDLLVCENAEGMTEYVVFTGNFTPSFGVRDCGDHYIKATYSGYVCIDKGTMQESKTEHDW